MERHFPADVTELFKGLFFLTVFTAQVGIITVAYALPTPVFQSATNEV